MSDHDLKKAGLKVTNPRLKILEILNKNVEHHLSAEEIYNLLKEQDEDVGVATVYRVLTQFEEAGLVIRHRFEGDQAVFELDRDEHHDHLVCVKCGLIEEFVDEVIEDRQEKIALKYGFKITEHNLTIYGICPKCN